MCPVKGDGKPSSTRHLETIGQMRASTNVLNQVIAATMLQDSTGVLRGKGLWSHGMDKPRKLRLQDLLRKQEHCSNISQLANSKDNEPSDPAASSSADAGPAGAAASTDPPSGDGRDGADNNANDHAPELSQKMTSMILMKFATIIGLVKGLSF